jgi:hypothetical protein
VPVSAAAAVSQVKVIVAGTPIGTTMLAGDTLATQLDPDGARHASPVPPAVVAVDVGVGVDVDVDVGVAVGVDAADRTPWAGAATAGLCEGTTQATITARMRIAAAALRGGAVGLRGPTRHSGDGDQAACGRGNVD